MGIGSKQNIEEQIKRTLREKAERINRAALANIIYVGEQFVNNARNNRTYKDRTGNLRSSIGFLVIKDGRIVYKDFKVTEVKGEKEGTDPITGHTDAEKFAQTIGEKYTRGFVLVVVAGMEYAAAVEARQYDVLTNSGIIADEALKQALKAIKLK